MGSIYQEMIGDHEDVGSWLIMFLRKTMGHQEFIGGGRSARRGSFLNFGL